MTLYLLVFCTDVANNFIATILRAVVATLCFECQLY
jgi:hypothetical protein